MKQPKKILDKITGGLFPSLFSSTEPILTKNQKLKPKKDFLVSYSELYHVDFKGTYDTPTCTVKKDMILTFHSEDKHKLFFIVASNFYQVKTEKEVHAKDKAIVYILKSNFDIKDFRL